MFEKYVRRLNLTRGGPVNPETPYLSYWAVLLNKVWNDTFDFGTSSYGICFEYYDTLSYVLSYTYYFGNVLWNETLLSAKYPIILYYEMTYEIIMLWKAILKYILHLLAHDSARALLWLRSPVPGPVLIRAPYDNSAVCCVTVPEASP